MSTDKAKRLNQLISEQEQILRGLKEEARAVDDNSLVEENERLSAALRTEELKNEALEKETEDLKNSLVPQRVHCSEKWQMKSCPYLCAHKKGLTLSIIMRQTVLTADWMNMSAAA